MANITVRNIPDHLMDKIRTLSHLDKRSINNEILCMLEKGLEKEEGIRHIAATAISRQTQIDIWEELAGQWEDSRSTREIIEDITLHRTAGREVDL